MGTFFPRICVFDITLNFSSYPQFKGLELCVGHTENGKNGAQNTAPFLVYLRWLLRPSCACAKETRDKKKEKKGAVKVSKCQAQIDPI